MKKLYTCFSAGFLILLLALTAGACKEKTPETCTYEYSHDTTEFTWTAYKFTEKLGVSGTFDEIKTAPPAPASSLYGSIDGLTFVIPVAGLNTGKPDRDQKIIGQFFHRLGPGREIRGIVTGIDAGANIASIEITLGSQTRTVSAPLEVLDEGSIEVTAQMNLADWQALDALKNLNKACYEEHKGEDGISKLWPDVSLKIVTRPVAVCN